MYVSDGGGGLSGYEIYRQLTDGPGTASLNGATQVADTESQAEQDRADIIKRIADKTRAGWQGTSGAASAGAATPIANAALEGATKLKLTQMLLESQGYSFSYAAGNVVPIAENPPQAGFWDEATPWDTDTESKIAQYQQDAQHNIDVYSRYDSESLSNEEGLPQEYTPLTDSGDQIAVKQQAIIEPPPAGHGQPPKTGGDPNQFTTRTSTTSTDHSQQQSQHPAKPDPIRTTPVPVQPPATTDIQHHIPTMPVDPPRTTHSRPRTPVGTPVQPPFGTPGPVGVGGTPGGAGTGGRGLAARGFGSGGGSGLGGESEGGGRGGAGGRGGLGGGMGALSEEELAARRAGTGTAAGAGGARGGMGGMGGGRRGQGGEDAEHTHASFLQEPDPEAIFGTDEMTAPPVIGE